MIRILFMVLFMSAANAADWYFLCGGDEDGCSAEHPEYCFCIPYDGAQANQAYCLNFNNLSCVPLSSKPDCQGGEVFKDQATCLAVAFQSEPTPLCPLTSGEFCQNNHVPTCEVDGGINTCHQS